MISIRIVSVIFSLILLFPSVILAHPGRTASDGCHYCKTNCDEWGVPWNQRHCHGGSIQGVQEQQPIYIQPTNTPIPLPTWTPVPTNTSMPPSNTPALKKTPTPTSKPTLTPIKKSPTSTNIPKPTHKPTSTITPTSVTKKSPTIKNKNGEAGKKSFWQWLIEIFF